MKTFTDSFVREKFSVEEDARSLWAEAKRRLGLAALISAKKSAEGGILTVAILEPLVGAARPVDNRLDISEDGVFHCMVDHPDSRFPAEVKAQGWTLTKEDGTPLTDRESGEPLRAGRFFVKSVHSLRDDALAGVRRKMEALTRQLTGASEKAVTTMAALVGVVCSFHSNPRKSPVTAAFIGRTTDKKTALLRLPKSEEFYKGRSRSKAEYEAMKESAEKKFRRAKNSSRPNYGKGRDGAETFQLGPLELFAAQAELVPVMQSIAEAYKDRLLEFSKLEPAQLVAEFPGLPEQIAPALIRKMREALGKDLSLDGARNKPSTERGRRRHAAASKGRRHDNHDEEEKE